MKYDFLLSTVCYMIYTWSVCSFCGKYLNGSGRRQKIFAGALFLTEVLRVIFSSQEYLTCFWGGQTHVPYIFSAMLSHVLFTGLLFLIFQDDAEKKAFAAVTVIAVKTLVGNFGSSFFSCLVLVFTNMLTGGWTSGIKPGMDNVIGAAACGMAALALIALGKRMDTLFQNKVKGWYLVLSIPPVLIVVIIDIVNWGASNGIMVVSNANGAKYWNVYYNQVFSHIAICLLTALAMCLATGYVFGLNRIYAEQRKKEQYYAQIAFYKMLNEQYHQMERLRHDIKNHLLALYGLWENEEFENLGSYLKKMMESGAVGTEDEVTGNKAVDALLYNKRKQAKRDEIRWESDVRISECGMIDDFDLCVLFGNILDNALNGCMKMQDKENRFVHIQVQKVKKYFLLVAKNGTVLRDKKELKWGTGLLNISETVKKHRGVMDIKIENHVFEISVLMPVDGDAYDRKQTI